MFSGGITARGHTHVAIRLNYHDDSAMFLLEAWEMLKEDLPAEPGSNRERATRSLLRLARLSARSAYALATASGDASRLLDGGTFGIMAQSLEEARGHWERLGTLPR